MGLNSHILLKGENNMTRLTTLDLPAFYKATVGFDRLFNEMERHYSNSNTSSGYPPYNIIQVNEDEYIISLAVAGFSMDSLEITKERNTLRIEGVSPKQDDDVQYLHRGIGGRSFRRDFTLADHVEVENATLELGILSIYLKRETPEELLPKKIAIKEYK